ncbi:hypothetical protein DERP_000856 [Dermatophagoides pteronyssinus]|uniref:Uncharacterized protein n=1 Tax=Dermatophagoides pteronyssinus TaxID=6956 RepID=A0ABQ8J1L8_DERPT|nr:hypothetical protein DERP_000856 [Dermatophagoides pteronyssinus]
MPLEKSPIARKRIRNKKKCVTAAAVFPLNIILHRIGLMLGWLIVWLDGWLVALVGRLIAWMDGWICVSSLVE